MYRETIIMLVFLVGFAFCLHFKSKDIWATKEGFKDKNKQCPNVLMQRGPILLLFNYKKALIPGVNPIRFENLEEYVQFTKWQRRLGIRCPVLYFQQTYDAQNNLGWRSLNSPLLPTAGTMTGLPPPPNVSANPPESPLLDANRLDPPYNIGDYPGYDQDNQYIGLNTPLDKIYHQSDIRNAMQNDWSPSADYVSQGVYFQQQRNTNVPPAFSKFGPQQYGPQQHAAHYSSFGQYNAMKDADAEYASRQKRYLSKGKQPQRHPINPPGAGGLYTTNKL